MPRCERRPRERSPPGRRRRRARRGTVLFHTSRKMISPDDAVGDLYRMAVVEERTTSTARLRVLSNYRVQALERPCKTNGPGPRTCGAGKRRQDGDGLSTVERSQKPDGIFFLTKIPPNFVAIGVSYAQLIAYESLGWRGLVMVTDEPDGLHYGIESMART